MVLKLISATPSPYARKIRIALAEKSIPFDLQTEVPWDATTLTPQYNPLEKLPVLITEAGFAIYESHLILEWIEFSYPPPKYPALFPHDKARELFAKQVQVVCDGICDAGVLLFFEMQRASPSEEWMGRQRRKVEGGLRALDGWVGGGDGDGDDNDDDNDNDKEFIVDGVFGVADVAAGSVLGYLKVRFKEDGWEGRYPRLKRYSDRLEGRESFRGSVPAPQTMKDRVV